MPIPLRRAKDFFVDDRSNRLLWAARDIPGSIPEESMRQSAFRAATQLDAAFALHVTEACMRSCAEQTWGTWNGLADLDLATERSSSFVAARFMISKQPKQPQNPQGHP